MDDFDKFLRNQRRRVRKATAHNHDADFTPDDRPTEMAMTSRGNTLGRQGKRCKSDDAQWSQASVLPGRTKKAPREATMSFPHSPAPLATDDEADD